MRGWRIRARADAADLSDKICHAIPGIASRRSRYATRRCVSYAAASKLQIPSCKSQIGMREKMQFYAAFIKLAQTFPFFLSEAESKIFPVIAMAKIVIEIFLLANQVVDPVQVLIAQFS